MQSFGQLWMDFPLKNSALIELVIVTSHDLGPQTVAEEVKSTEIPRLFHGNLRLFSV